MTNFPIVEQFPPALRGAGEAAVSHSVSPADPYFSLIERAARDPSVDADKMIKLYELSQRAAASRAKDAYAEALARLQPELPAIGKRGQIKVNNDVRSTYARWEDVNEQIKPLLGKHGFSLSFRIETSEKIKIKGVLTHEGGHSEETEIALPIDASGSKNPVQAVGSSVSYGKRYTAGALLNLTSKDMEADDDATTAPSTIEADQIAFIEQQLRDTGSDKAAFLKAFKVESVEGLTQDAYKRALTMFARKKAQTK